MPNLKDMTSLIGNGKSMKDEMDIDPKIQSDAIAKVNEGITMLDEAGMNGREFVMAHLSGKKEMMEESSECEDEGMKEPLKMIIIKKLKEENESS